MKLTDKEKVEILEVALLHDQMQERKGDLEFQAYVCARTKQVAHCVCYGEDIEAYLAEIKPQRDAARASRNPVVPPTQERK